MAGLVKKGLISSEQATKPMRMNIYGRPSAHSNHVSQGGTLERRCATRYRGYWDRRLAIERLGTGPYPLRGSRLFRTAWLVVFPDICPAGFPERLLRHQTQAKGAQSTEHWMLIGKWDRGAYQFSGRGPLFPESFA